MSGKGSGRCKYQGWGRGRAAIVNSYSGDTPKNNGLWNYLGNHVFDYGQKVSSDKMRTTWYNIVYHVGTIHGHDISN